MTDALLQAQKRLGHTLERASIGEDRELATAVREKGEAFANLFFGTMRLSRMYEINNESFERPIAELTSPEGIVLAWQPIEKLGDLPLVSDIAELLPKVLASGAPFFATESFDGSDKQLAMRVEVFDG